LIPGGEDVLRAFLESKGYRVVYKRLVEMFAIHKDYLNEFGFTL
jgi:hypothetical protein